MPMVNWLRLSSFFSSCIRRTRTGAEGVLGAQTVTAADDAVSFAGVGQRGDDVEVQGLALCAGLLGAVEDGDLLGGRGDGLDQLVG